MLCYEFFSGGGMARLGLGSAWECLFANDLDPAKAQSYRAAFGPCPQLRVCDLAEIEAGDLPGRADLAWASFPCQDLSLAGNGEGLGGRRSGLFWTFWRLMRAMVQEGRAPRVVLLENVYGAITSRKGRDLAAICEALTEEGYVYAPLVVDAQLFLPQSRPRLFLVAYHPDCRPPESLFEKGPCRAWHPESFGLAYDRLSAKAREAWRWACLPAPQEPRRNLSELIESGPGGQPWHSAFETRRLLDMMTPLHQEKVARAKASGKLTIGTVYRRTRADETGRGRQRAEVRFDEVAGCLRTPSGGSSRQTLLVVQGQSVRSRLLSPREAARLMGLPDSYPLPERYNAAYKLAGDGVAVPVVAWLARHLIEPALAGSRKAVAT